MKKRTPGLQRSAIAVLALALAGCGLGGPPVVAQSQGAIDPAIMAANNDRSQVVLTFKDRAQLEQLAASGVDLFENVDHDKHTVGASLTKQTTAIVQKLGVKFQAVQATTRGFPTGYGTVEAAHAELRKLAADFPAIVHLVDAGRSIEGRPILGIRITSKPDTGLPAIRFTGGVHARELVPVELLKNLTRLMTSSYGKDAAITNLVDNRETYIFPVWNPDGRTLVEKGADMWRKNAHVIGGRVTGVDINRNADDHFDGGNSSTWADDYHGEAPFSEPETVAMRDLAMKVKFKVALDVHCYGGMLLWPPGYSTTVGADEAKFNAIGEKVAKPMGYKYGTIARTIYKTYGDFATWEWAKLGTLSFAAELNDGGFNPNFSQVERDWGPWKNNFLFMIDAAGNSKAKHSTEGSLLGFSGF